MNELKEYSTQLQEVENYNKYSIYWLASFAAITIIVWNVPFGNFALYPFTILGTWFHEMAHGLAAIAVGGKFHRLEIYPDGSGVAYFSGDLFFGRIGHAFVAFAGPVGPTIAGALFILSSSNKKLTSFLLGFLGFFILLSAIVWVRSPFGAIFVISFGLLIVFLSIKANYKVKQIVLQLLGVQAIVSLYQSVGYLFSSGAEIGEMSIKSDTAYISHYLFLPYWFWAFVILAFSAVVFYYSFKYVYKKSMVSR